MGIKSDVSLKLAIDFNASANAFGGVWWNGVFNYDLSFLEGVGANQANKVVLLERTVASGANDDVDIYGAIFYPVQGVVNAAELVGMIIVNRRADPDGAANTTSLTIGGGANNATDAFITGTTKTIGPLRPDGLLMLINPDADGLGAVTSGTADIIRVANGAGASNTYVIALLVRTS